MSAAAQAVDPASHASKSRNSPYEGMPLPGRVYATFLRGVPTALDGKAVPDGKTVLDSKVNK